MTMHRTKICGGKRYEFPDLAKMLDMEEVMVKRNYGL